jgi:serine/threonine-protein kinase haspin
MPTVMPMQEHNLNTTGRKREGSPKAPMDDAMHGVHTTLIDLGLSRMDAGDGAGGEMVHWTPFDEEIFLGEGK